MRFLNVAIVAGFALMGARAFAINASLHLSQPQDKVQTEAGSEASDPISPGIALGHAFRVADKYYFAPQLGYVRNEVKSDDHFGGKYQIETIYLHYDFFRPVNQSETFRAHFGLASFMKRTKGEGGTVTIPNGTGYSVAYKPGETQTSYSGAISFGADWEFYRNSGSTIQAYSLFAQIFILEALDDRRRLPMFQLGLNTHF